MRYISQYENLVLITDSTNQTPPLDDPNPKAVYTFSPTGLGYGVYIAGDPTTDTGTGNAIDPTGVMVLYPGAATDLEKIGLGKIFWESPELDNSATLDVGKVYEVLRGSIEYNSKTYNEGDRFTVVTGATSFTGDGIIALAIDNFDLTASENGLNHRKWWYYVNNLSSYADEAIWDEGNWRGTSRPDAWKWIRTP